MKVALVIPTYKEAENITRFIRDLKLRNLNLTIIVVDDASPDGTGEIVSKIPDVVLISRKGKLELGSSYKEGFKYAFGHGYNIVVTMDADFSHGPKYLPNMLTAIKNCDVVIGSRYVPGGR